MTTPGDYWMTGDTAGAITREGVWCPSAVGTVETVPTTRSRRVVRPQ